MYHHLISFHYSPSQNSLFWGSKTLLQLQQLQLNHAAERAQLIRTIKSIYASITHLRSTVNRKAERKTLRACLGSIGRNHCGLLSSCCCSRVRLDLLLIALDCFADLLGHVFLVVLGEHLGAL